MNRIVLNGAWDFCFDSSYGTITFPNNYNKKINLPYQVESKLSGINYEGNVCQCWYKKEIEGFALGESETLIFHIGACDYLTTVFVNKQFVGRHVGGYTPIELDIASAWNQNGINVIEVVAQDNMKIKKASGKQTMTDAPHGCFYTRTTGIWQTVYLEKREKERVLNVKFYPNIHNPSVGVEISSTSAGVAKVEVYYKNKLCGVASEEINCNARFEIALSEKHLWKLGKGRLYDVVITFGKDVQKHKFGLREVKYEGYKFLLNGKSVFQRLVLDQGYYEEGIYSPADLGEFERDIQRSIQLGFNGARLHQKLFHPEYLEVADRYGFMVWGEYASWGINQEDISYLGTFLNEWKEAMDRDFNHPCIVTWCPLNEVWSNTTPNHTQPDLRFVDGVYEFTKAYDSTRPCVDVSGGYHGKATDLFDFHFYKEASELKDIIKRIEDKNEVEVDLLYGMEEHKYPAFAPINVSEYGGIAMNISEDKNDVNTAWGYGNGENSSAKLVDRIIELNNIIMQSERISGLCYTQLYDVMQEQNGLLTYSRKFKLDEEDIKRLNKNFNQKAKIED